MTRRHVQSIRHPSGLFPPTKSHNEHTASQEEQGIHICMACKVKVGSEPTGVSELSGRLSVANEKQPGCGLGNHGSLRHGILCHPPG